MFSKDFLTNKPLKKRKLVQSRDLVSLTGVKKLSLVSIFVLLRPFEDQRK